jgi:hypothetical protein
MQNLKYKIGLCNVFWNKNGIDTKYFNDVEAQKNYFLNKINGGANLSPLVNFNINDNITTIVTYQDNSARTIEELIACNYAVILKYNTETNEIINTRYFFAKASQLSGRQMRVELDLDDLQTNYFRYKNNIAPCIINRAHLNRFIDNGDNTISFNLNSDSHLFDIENEDFTKILSKRTKLKIYYGNDLITNWINENIAFWVYAFIDKNHTYNVKNPTNNNTSTINGNLGVIKYGKKTTLTNGTNVIFDNGAYTSETACVFYPVYKNNGTITNRIIVKDNNNSFTIDIGDLGYNEFRKLNENASYIFTSKISPLALLDFETTQTTFNIENNNLIITAGTYNETDQLSIGGGVRTLATIRPATTGTSYDGVFFGGYVYLLENKETAEISTSDKFIFNKNELIGATRNLIFNPKMLASPFKSIVIKSSDGNKFELDLQKIGKNTMRFLYNEAIQPEVSKYYIRLKAPSGLYIENNNKNYNGLVASVDNSLAIANDQYSNFIANNKNYWLQSSFQIGENLFKGIMGTAFSAGMGNIPGAIAGGISTITGAVSGVVNRNLNIDNMREAPGNIKNAQGNPIFNASIDEIGFYIEEYDALIHDKQQADDIMYKNGFVYGEIGNIADFDNIRTIFNYISADIDGINANISDEEKTRLIEKLKSVRFWNIDGFDYINENYERSIANG